MIGRKSFLIVITHYIADILGIISFIVLAKLWGDFSREAIGIVSFSLSFIALFNIFTDLGFSKAHIKRISEGKNIGKCIGTFATIKIILTSTMVIAVLVFLFIWKNVLNKDFYDATTESVIYVIIFYSIFNNLRNIFLHTFTAKGEIAKLQTTKLVENFIKTPLTILVAIAGVSVIGTSISPALKWPVFLQPFQRFLAVHAIGALAMTYLFGILATFIVGLWLIRKEPIKKPSIKLTKNYFSFAYPIAISSIVNVLAQNIDKVMIGYFLTSVNVGDYYVVQRITAFVSILYISVGTVLFPTLSKKISENDINTAKKIVKRAERYISMIFIPPLIMIVVFAEPTINIMLDSAYLPAVPVLVIMTFFCFVRGMTLPYSNLLFGLDRPGITAKYGVIVCVINIVLNYFIIPRDGLLSSFGIYGSAGAAFTTFTSFLIPFIAYRFIAKRLTGIKLLQTHTLRHIIAGIIMGFILNVIAYRTAFFPEIRFYTLFGFAGIGLLIYLVILIILKEFDKDDFNFFLNIIHPKEMFNYVKSELKNRK